MGKFQNSFIFSIFALCCMVFFPQSAHAACGTVTNTEVSNEVGGMVADCTSYTQGGNVGLPVCSQDYSNGDQVTNATDISNSSCMIGPIVNNPSSCSFKTIDIMSGGAACGGGGGCVLGPLVEVTSQQPWPANFIRTWDGTAGAMGYGGPGDLCYALNFIVPPVGTGEYASFRGYQDGCAGNAEGDFSPVGPCVASVDANCGGNFGCASECSVLVHNCDAPTAVNGACGPANGTTTATAPSGATNLCANGTTPTAVSGSGPWTWGCNGLNGGTNTSATACSASPAAASCETIGFYDRQASRIRQRFDNTNTAVNTYSMFTTPNYNSSPSCASLGYTVFVGDDADFVTSFNANQQRMMARGRANTAGYGDRDSCWELGDSENTSGAADLRYTGEYYVKTTACTPTVVNGSCGSANGTTTASAPSGAGLCSAGAASVVSNNPATWDWTCAGSGGGGTATCSATKPAAAVNGTCGAAHNVGVSSAPSSNLCASGTPTAVSGSGPWTWNCNGQNGGGNASCNAPLIVGGVSGQCGTANGGSFGAAPSNMAAMCRFGSSTGATLSAGNWVWTCNGSNGNNASCSAVNCAPPVINGACLAHPGSYPTQPATSTLNGCTAGTYADLATDTATTWRWECQGQNGGGSTSCSAARTGAPVNGVCGTADGQVSASAPSANLCSVTATAPTVTDGGTTWEWTCDGPNGGLPDSCSAPKTDPNCVNLGSPVGGQWSVNNAPEYVWDPTMGPRCQDLGYTQLVPAGMASEESLGIIWCPAGPEPGLCAQAQCIETKEGPGTWSYARFYRNPACTQ